MSWKAKLNLVNYDYLQDYTPLSINYQFFPKRMNNESILKLTQQSSQQHHAQLNKKRKVNTNSQSKSKTFYGSPHVLNLAPLCSLKGSFNKKHSEPNTTLKEMLGTFVENQVENQEFPLIEKRQAKKKRILKRISQQKNMTSQHSDNIFSSQTNQNRNCDDPNKMHQGEYLEEIKDFNIKLQYHYYIEYQNSTKPSRCLEYPNYSIKFKSILNEYENKRIQKDQINMTKLNTEPTINKSKEQKLKNKSIQRKNVKENQQIKIQSLVSKLVSTPIQVKIDELENQKKNITVQRSTQTQGSDMSPSKKITNFDNKLFGGKAIQNVLKQAPKYERLTKQEKLKKIRIALLKTINYLNKLNISGKEVLTYYSYTQYQFLQNQIFSNKAFEKPNSKDFIQACKSNKQNVVFQLLEKNKYLVHDYDNLLMTGLHWCAKRGNSQIAQKLLYNGADPDCQDLVGRTPLYLAIQNGSLDVIQLLLYKQCDPWNKENCNYQEVLSGNLEAQKLLSQSRKIHILLKMTPASQRQMIWQKEQLAFFLDPTMKQTD